MGDFVSNRTLIQQHKGSVGVPTRVLKGVRVTEKPRGCSFGGEIQLKSQEAPLKSVAQVGVYCCMK